MTKPTVPKIEFAAFDAMCEVASWLKSGFLRRAAAAEKHSIQEGYWIEQARLVNSTMREVDQTDLAEITATSEFFASLLEVVWPEVSRKARK
ncbi:hypothetical protein G7Y31_11660 [Corynebacterium lizhenjunii]|uniref:Uncharacterized protein n=1 Tax=Corynebacterium lizhenjunii TaxID=2709394 RepID=A0A7T0PBY3_9CORY|nr:hypothetical protein [Corynebacterium lizhenjunii]QPK79127.1 hypothetical protein G7Y31_11660 [Corynebacterium lizhenjunii]